MKNIFKKYFAINLDLSTNDPNYNRAYLLNALIIITSFLFLFFSVYNYVVTKLYTVMIINMLGFILVVISIWVLRRLKKLDLAGSMLVFSVFMTSLAFIFQENHHDYALFYAVFFPFFSIFLLGVNKGLTFTAIYYAIFYIIIFTGIDAWGEVPFTFVSFTNIVVVTICLTLFAFFYEITRIASFDVIRKAHNKEHVQSKVLKAALDELNEYKNNLEIKVQNALQEKLAQEQIIIQQSKMAAMGEMLAAIAHQWKQPLTITTGIIGNLKMDLLLEGNDNSAFDEGLDDILNQTQFMAQTITDFSSFFKPSIKEENFELHQALDDVVVLLGEQLNSFSIQLNINRWSTPIKISGFRNEFLQVLLNIINNAKDAIIEQTAKNTNSDFSPQIILTVTQHNAVTRLTLFNNGSPIPQEILEKIFEPYFTTKPEDKGTGIGLHMAKMIIEEKMKATIRAENLINGVAFTIEFKQ